MIETERRKVKLTLQMKLGGLFREQFVQLHLRVRQCQKTVRSLETVWVSSWKNK